MNRKNKFYKIETALVIKGVNRNIKAKQCFIWGTDEYYYMEVTK